MCHPFLAARVENCPMSISHFRGLPAPGLKGVAAASVIPTYPKANVFTMPLLRFGGGNGTMVKNGTYFFSTFVNRCVVCTPNSVLRNSPPPPPAYDEYTHFYCL